jgi:hypothetical protein
MAASAVSAVANSRKYPTAIPSFFPSFFPSFPAV